jgi:O-antigen ligase
MDTSDREPQPLPGTTQKPPPESGPIRSYGWEWGRDEDRQPQLPWIGIFLVVLGGLLLLDRVLPEYVNVGSVLVLAAGLAFLLLWVLRRGTFPLYAGAFLTAAAVPGLVEALTGRELNGLGTLCYGVAFLFIAAVRGSRGGGVGWQALVGVLLAALGASQLALPDMASLVLPLLLVVLGVVFLTRGGRELRH